MKPLRLYRIELEGFPAIHVAARSSDQAAQMFVTWEASVGRSARSFSVELVSMQALDSKQQTEVQSLLAVSTEGIAYFEQGHGWSIDSDGWTSFAPGEEAE